MNELQKLFDFRGQQLRVVEQNNEPWFVAKDVCDILEIKNNRDALSKLDEEEKGVALTDTLGGKQKLSIVNESGLYELIFTSRKLEAKVFKKWVKQEVLPSIRKHGAYMTNETIEKVITSPDFLIQLATNLKEEQEARRRAETKLEKQQPLVRFAEACMATNKSMLVRELAKLISKEGLLIGEKRLFQKLREWKLIFQNKNEPYQKYIDNEFFSVSQGVTTNSGGSHAYLTMRVTPKGQAYIVNRLKKEQQGLAI
ncbi:BRO family protein [Fictibacillus sp. JL2B1089]|uniref:BRO family protein n=1 Tax=Fictibacillus sp. JL2B1089 TaxID=3399565 RepID=UPI003A8A2B37